MKWIYFGFFDHHITNSEHAAEELPLASTSLNSTPPHALNPPEDRSLRRSLVSRSTWSVTASSNRPAYHGHLTDKPRLRQLVQRLAHKSKCPGFRRGNS